MEALPIERQIEAWQRRGYVVQSHTPAGVLMRKPKHFSLVWFLVWFLFLPPVLGGVFYGAYYLSKRDAGVHLTAPS